MSIQPATIVQLLPSAAEVECWLDKVMRIFLNESSVENSNDYEMVWKRTDVNVLGETSLFR